MSEPRDEDTADAYIPLFAGTEIVERSGELARYGVQQLLGNLPEEEEE